MRRAERLLKRLIGRVLECALFEACAGGVGVYADEGANCADMSAREAAKMQPEVVDAGIVGDEVEEAERQGNAGMGTTEAACTEAVACHSSEDEDSEGSGRD